jgi:hypothetical protein
MRDVLIDSAGVAAGFAAMLLWGRYGRRRRKEGRKADRKRAKT